MRVPLKTISTVFFICLVFYHFRFNWKNKKIFHARVWYSSIISHHDSLMNSCIFLSYLLQIVQDLTISLLLYWQLNTCKYYWYSISCIVRHIYGCFIHIYGYVMYSNCISHIIGNWHSIKKNNNFFNVAKWKTLQQSWIECKNYSVCTIVL